MPPRSRWFFILTLFLLAGHPAQAQTVEIPVRPVPGTRAPTVPLPARLWLPPGKGPFAAVILLHGCGGLGNGAQIRDWADRLNAWGYAALSTDSMTPRGVKTVCAPSLQPSVTPADRAGDVINAALYLRSLAVIDPNRIGVIGFSHGGATASVVTMRKFQDLYPGLLKAVVDYYGACRQPGLHGTVPLQAFAGLDDTWGDPARICTEFGAHLKADQPFQIVTYPDTVHAFDNYNLVSRRMEEGHPMQFNASSATDSFTRTRAFLAQWMAP